MTLLDRLCFGVCAPPCNNILPISMEIGKNYGNGAPAMFTFYHYLNLKGKHCRKPNCRNGVVDQLEQIRFHKKKPNAGLY